MRSPSTAATWPADVTLSAPFIGTPTPIPGTECRLGESPVWDPRSSRLRWVDLMGGVHHHTDVVTGEDEAVDVGGACGFVVLADEGIGYARNSTVLRRDSSGVSEIVDLDPDAVLRINDSQVAPGGWLFCGTMAVERDRRPSSAVLMRVARDGASEPATEGLSICNGMGWSPDGRTMFHVDTMDHRVDRLDFDPMTGEATNRRPAFSTDAFGGMPDGLAVDTEGRIWLAHFGTPFVVCTDDEGREIARVELPVTNVTSCAFGGPDLSTLFVTTSFRDGTGEHPHDGAVFAVPTDARGQEPRFWSR